MDNGISIILKYFPDLTQKQQQQLSMLQELYSTWNSRINVISRKDIDHLYERHVLHSLGIACVIKFKPGTSILDVGTGGGFPGIPLAILFPDSDFFLVDSIGKKIKVVNEIAAALRLKNLQAEQLRAEQVRERFDFIVSRAVTEFPAFYGWVKNKIKPKGFNDLPNGILYLKGGDLQEEMRGYYKKASIFELNDCFEETFFETKKVVFYPFG